MDENICNIHVIWFDIIFRKKSNKENIADDDSDEWRDQNNTTILDKV